MKEDIKALISSKFVEYPQSPKIIDFQEKLCAKMYEVYDDCRSKGMSERASYKQATSIVRI